MTLALDTAPLLARPARRAGLSLSVCGWDVLALAVLAALWAMVIPLHYDIMPLQLWDESRNANNALEVAQHGHWLAPTYAGATDHWNTKPPLLIWAMAGLLRLGLPTLVALRLTSWLAAAATVAMVWGVLRGALRDRLAAFAGGVLLLSALAYVGEHAARTGDYDALETAFILGYSLSIWAAFEDGRARWLVLAAGLMGLGVLTKGVAALLPVPGLCVYALTRPARLVAFLKDWRTFAAVALFAAVACGYYALREAIDPGYLKAVAGNELGGRFLKVTENHHGSWHFYIAVLGLYAEPCTLLCALGFIPLFGADARRRSLVLAMGLAGGSLLLVLSASKSKMSWYITPLVPLLCVIAGAGLSDALRWMEARRRRFAGYARGGAALALAGGAVFAIGWNQVEPTWTWHDLGGAHFRYGPFLEAVRARALAPQVTVVDTGFRNDAGFPDYDPMLKFYADLLRPRGLVVEVAHADAGRAPGEAVGSCDPSVLRALHRDYRLQPLLDVRGCELSRVVGAAQL